jgi:hypothetical protein
MVFNIYPKWRKISFVKICLKNSQDARKFAFKIFEIKNQNQNSRKNGIGQ